ncbi:MAG: hypothetical protein WCI92_06920 [Bacteroidota bacterium]
MKTNEQQWKLIYKIAAISAFIALFTMLTEIFLTALPDGARVMHGISELFDMYNRNWFMAMRYMGLINIIATSLMVPVFFALYGLHREKMQVFASFSLIISLLGYVVFMADNVSFPFLTLAGKYAAAATDVERNQLLAAGEALFTKGASHTPGTFPGFFIGHISSILFSIIILKAGILKKAVGMIGLIAFSFLLIFEIISSFVVSLYNEAMIFAMIGGPLALVWYAMIGIGLLKQSKATENGILH